MRAGIAGLVLGVIFLQHQAVLPGWMWLFFAGASGILLFCLSFLLNIPPGGILRRVLCLAGGLLLGIFWAAVFARFYLSDELPEALEGKNIIVTGTVGSLPRIAEQGRTFEFFTEQAEFAGKRVIVPDKIRLSWNHAFGQKDAWLLPDVQPGARWRLNVRLKRPHGSVNPDGFDYEAWLLRQRIRATGFVRHGKAEEIGNRELDPFVISPGNLVNRARSLLREHIRQALPGARYVSIIVALVIGDQQGIGQSDWDIFNRTGISHLVSISGLHITLISGMFAAFFSFLWRRSFFTRLNLPLFLPTGKAAAVAGVGMAWIYVLLAGFGLPAQRTLYMLFTVAVALWTGRITRISHVLFAALGMVVLFDPWAVLAPGFWLSFGAVGIILYISAGRTVIFVAETGKNTRRLHTLKTAVRVQLAITVGLIPLTLLFFGRISLISPLANAVAIPLVGMVVTPLSLIGSILPSFPGQYILGFAHYLVGAMVWLLEWLGAFPLAAWDAPIPRPGFFLIAFAGTVWMLAPRGWPTRWLGVACWLPLFLLQPTRPPSGEAQGIALDVGQGSAILIETATHRLLYDTGPSHATGSNAGVRTILPYLRARGIRSLDALVISHGDMDHAGGAASILTDPGLRVGDLYSSLALDDPLAALAVFHRNCLDGQAWEWDGVRFEMLAPDIKTGLAGKGKTDANAMSCVLKVTAGSQSVLLTGDIGVMEEFDLLLRMSEKLKSDILVVPHHGSHTSSSLAFLEAVRPVVAIFQLGYRNRYGHPDDAVYARYEALGIGRMRTDRDGAITFRFGRGIKAKGWRSESARYWYGR